MCNGGNDLLFGLEIVMSNFHVELFAILVPIQLEFPVFLYRVRSYKLFKNCVLSLK